MAAFAPTSTTQGVWQIEQIYIGYYGRAADAAGYDYWQTEFNARTNGTYKIANVVQPKQSAADAIASIASSFGASGQSETIALYPFLAGTVSLPSTDNVVKAQITSFVNSVYQNLFNRAPDAAGQTYWVNQIATGAFSTSVAILTIANAAGADGSTQSLADAKVLNNKIAVSDNFLYTTALANVGTTGNVPAAVIAQAKAVLTGVDGTDATVTTANTAQAAWLASGAGTPGSTFTLTTGVDTGAAFTGGAGNDTFNGSDTTITALDSIDGGNGIDTLNVNDAAVPSAVSLSKLTAKNIEILNFTSATDLKAGALNVSTWAGLTNANITLQNVAAAQTITTAGTTNVNLNAAVSAAAGVTITGGPTISATLSNAVDNSASSLTVNATSGKTTAVTINQTGASKGAKVVVTDGGVAGATATITSVSIANNAAANNSGTAAAITSNALTSLSLTKSGDGATVTAAAGTRALGITLNGDTAGTIKDDTATTLNVTSTGAETSGITLSGAAAKTLNFAGDKALSTTLAALGGLTKINVSGSGGLTADASALALVTAIDASASTGANQINLDASKSTYTGGSGVDTVTVGATISKAIDGGAGTSDVLVVNAATFAGSTKVVNFETLALGSLAAGNFDATGFSNVLVNGTITGASTFTNVAAGTALTLTAAPGQDVTYTLKTDTTSDVANVTLSSADALALAGKNLNLTTVETINLTVTDTNTTLQKDTLNIVDTAAKTLTITGNSGLALTAADVTYTTVDASGLAITNTGLTAAGDGFTWTSGAVTGNIVVKGSATGYDSIDLRLAATAGKTVSITEYAGTNTVFGSATLVNTITGGTGADTITGGIAADIIVGGGGADVISGGKGADTITVSGTTATVKFAAQDSGSNTATNTQTNLLTSTLDVVKGLVAGDKIDLSVTAAANLIATNSATLQGTAGKVVFAAGTYDAANGLFNYGAAGADTAMTYDGAASAFETVILVGYHVGATTAIAGNVVTLA